MKRGNLFRAVGASILSLSLVTLPAHLPASAQTTTGGTGNTSTNTGGGYTATNNNDGGNAGYWGLLGLLGLFGLLGRSNKGRVTAYRDPNEVSGGSSTIR